MIKLTKLEIKMILKSICTEMGFICQNISKREMSKNTNATYNEYLDNLTKEDKKYLEELEILENKLKGADLL